MKTTILQRPFRLILVFICAFSIAACSIKDPIPERDEVVGGVRIPIPAGMSRVSDGGVELSLPGFGGERRAYRGDVDPEEILAFYKSEMPERGWKSNASLAAKGGMQAYTRDNRSVLVTVSSPGRGGTTLNIVVGSMGSK